MKVFLQFILFLIVACLPAFIATSCSQEDDIDEIFRGKSWKITGACIRGTSLNGTDLKELYNYDNSYELVFVSNKINGILAPGSTFAGTWNASGKNRSFSCTIDSYTNFDSSTLSTDLFNILLKCKEYKGDSNVLMLKADNANYIRLTNVKGI